MSDFGSKLTNWRRAAGLGLRTFAALIDQRTSVVSAIEQGARRPWRDPLILDRVARALGAELDSPEYEQLWDAASATNSRSRRHGDETDTAAGPAFAPDDILLWHNGAVDAPLDEEGIDHLARFLGATARFELQQSAAETTAERLPLTDLAVEWRARRTLGRRDDPYSSGAADVEAALENAGWQIAVVPGLLPRFSVAACAVRQADGQLALVVDRVHADVRPLAQYRLLLAATAAPLALSDTLLSARAMAQEPGSRRLCEQFALAMLLPAAAVGAAAERVYRELCASRGIPSLDVAARELRNRLATRLAAPAELVDRRLAAWPCRAYDRVRLAIAAEEPTLPPVDWLPEWRPARQQRLFQ